MAEEEKEIKTKSVFWVGFQSVGVCATTISAVPLFYSTANFKFVFVFAPSFQVWPSRPDSTTHIASPFIPLPLNPDSRVAQIALIRFVPSPSFLVNVFSSKAALIFFTPSNRRLSQCSAQIRLKWYKCRVRTHENIKSNETHSKNKQVFKTFFSGLEPKSLPEKQN